jgi:hypothetical protein
MAASLSERTTVSEYQKEATRQDERDRAPVEKPILLEGHFGLLLPGDPTAT